MANERLRSAMAKAQADIEAITQATGVDPKTVQRWLTGRIPIHVIVGRSPTCSEKTRAMARRSGLIFLLELKQPLRSSPPTDTVRISRTRGGQTFMTDRRRQIDPLGYAFLFPPRTVRGPCALSIERKCASGCKVASRLLTRR